MVDDETPPSITLKNYRVLPLDHTRAAEIESRFAKLDSDTSNIMCITCSNKRRGKYAWTCLACQADCDHHIIIGYMRVNDGALHPGTRCLRCGLGDFPPIPKGGDLWEVCVRDYQAMFASDPCARCGSTAGAQLHHWAPRAIFDDADLWPMSYLCPPCHRIWHTAMRAAGGWRLKVKAAAA
jgi:hypothetical protein